MSDLLRKAIGVADDLIDLRERAQRSMQEADEVKAAISSGETTGDPRADVLCREHGFACPTTLTFFGKIETALSEAKTGDYFAIYYTHPPHFEPARISGSSAYDLRRRTPGGRSLPDREVFYHTILCGVVCEDRSLGAEGAIQLPFETFYGLETGPKATMVMNEPILTKLVGKAVGPEVIVGRKNILTLIEKRPEDDSVAENMKTVCRQIDRKT